MKRKTKALRDFNRRPTESDTAPMDLAPSNHQNLDDLISASTVTDHQVRVTALRELKKLVTGSHPNIAHLPQSARISLSTSISSFPLTAKLASQCLLPILNHSSANILSQQSQSILNPILSALSSSIQRSRSSPSKDQLVLIAYLFRILSTVLVKVGPCALISLSDQIDYIQHGYQPIPLTRNSFQPPERIVLNSPHRSNTKLAPSTSRLERSDSETSSDAEHFLRPLNNDPQAIQCRLDALNYLRTLVQSDSKALYPFWPRLLPTCESKTHQPYTLFNVIESDSQLVVRLRASGLIKKMLEGAGGYMAIAEENNSRTSYIPLSAQLASMTIELHRRLGRLLAAPLIGFEFTKDMLEICETMTKVSAYHRISTPILELLMNPIIDLLTSSDFAINQQASRTLIVILHNLTSASQATISNFTDLVNRIALIGCLHLTCDQNEISVSLWCELIKSTLPFLTWTEDLVQKFLTLRNLLETIPSNQDEAKGKLYLLGSLCVFFPGADFDKIFLRWVKVRLRDDGLDSLDIVVNGKCERILSYVADNLDQDLQNVWDDVRAIRLIGIIVSKRCTSNLMILVPKVVFHILNYYDDIVANDESDEKVLSTHTWVMANCLEVIKDFDNRQALKLPFDLYFWAKILKIIQHLISENCSSNSLKTSCVRIIGVTVCQLLQMDGPGSLELRGDISSAIIRILRFLDVSFPKVQWNAANALRLVLNVLIARTTESKHLSQTLTGQISEKLCDSLETNESFKVRIQVSLALQVVHQTLSDQILESISRTKNKLEDQLDKRQIPDKEIDHAHRLQFEIQKLLNRPG